MISENALTEALEVVSVPEKIDDIKLSAFQKWAETLPDKAFNLVIRVGFTIFFLIVGVFVIRFLRNLLKKTLTKMKIEKGAITFADSCLKIVLYGFLILTIAINYGFDAASIVAVLGSVGIAIGLSLQGALSNFAGGIIILFLKPFVVGDYISEDTKGNEGTVTEITVFYTRLRTTDNRIVSIPNGTLANSSMTNNSRMPKRMQDLRIGIGYGADIKTAKNLIIKVIENCELVLKDEPVTVFVHDLHDSSVLLGVRCWTLTENYLPVKWKLLEEIKETFDEHRIEIPYPQLDVHLKENS